MIRHYVTELKAVKIITMRIKKLDLTFSIKTGEITLFGIAFGFEIKYNTIKINKILRIPKAMIEVLFAIHIFKLNIIKSNWHFNK